jgi:hypothetical protein
MRNASLAWSAVQGSAFRFTWGGNSPSLDVRDHANGNNDLYFDSQLPPFGYAVTYAFELGEGIVERDVAFNGSGAVSWSTAGGTNGGGPADVETVALHELGHVLGLLHEDSVPAVMKSGGDPSIVRRTLLADDEDGVRFLYPAGGGGGGGGAAGPDLAAGTLTITSGTPGIGNRIFLRVEVRNRSALSAGPFRVKATLSPALPVAAGDEEIGSTEVAALAGGNAVLVDLDAFVPAATPPGRWRLGAFVDPEGATGDPARANNGAATGQFTATRPPAALELGDTLDAGLGPLGSDGSSAWIGAGTEVRLRVRGERGVRPVVRVRAAGEAAVLAEDAGARRASLRWTAPADGTYEFEVASASEAVGRYRLLTSGRARERGRDATAPAEVPFPAYPGGTVTLRALYEGEAAAPACRPPSGPEFAGPAKVRGRRAVLGPLSPDVRGTHVFVLGGTGPVRVSFDSRTPRPGGLVVR